MSAAEKRDDVAGVLRSLLISKKGNFTVKQLEQDYYAAEGQPIPFRELGYISVRDFLRNIREHVVFVERSDEVQPVISKNVSHVSSLVRRQKSSSKPRRSFRRGFRANQYFPATRPPRTFIPFDLQKQIVQIVRQNPQGVNVDYISNSLLRSDGIPTHITSADIESQLKSMSQFVNLRGNFVTPVPNTATTRATQNERPSPRPLLDICVAKPEIFRSNVERTHNILPAEYAYDEEDDMREEIDYESVNQPAKPQVLDILPSGYILRGDTVATKKSTAHHLQQSLGRQEIEQNDEPEIQRSLDRSVTEDVKEDVKEGRMYFSDDERTVDLVSPRTKFRLEKLIQTHPDGIWCADLPDEYEKEYKIALDYSGLGFSSVWEFCAQIPDVFHCVRLEEMGDFKIFDAKKPLPDLQMRQKPVLKYDLCDMDEYDLQPFPVMLPEYTSKKLIPDCVLTIGESVGQETVSSCTQLAEENGYLEVCVEEVNTPSCFWVQLRRNRLKLSRLMDEMQLFYETEGENYHIPAVVMEKGLNCACMYGTQWHRAIIKTVKPDGNVTVDFYDFGTIKTYPPNNLRFLHRSYSCMPAQAIPCKLDNLKPAKGSQWTIEASQEFLDMVANVPLIAFIINVDEQNNSLMVALVDTQGDDDIHINDWMVEQNLATYGSMVGTRIRNFQYRHYISSNSYKRDCVKNLKATMTRLSRYKNEISLMRDIKKNLQNRVVKNSSFFPAIKKDVDAFKNQSDMNGEDIDFGTFRSMMGGRGHMKQIDWFTVHSNLESNGAKKKFVDREVCSKKSFDINLLQNLSDETDGEHKEQSFDSPSSISSSGEKVLAFQKNTAILQKKNAKIIAPLAKKWYMNAVTNCKDSYYKINGEEMWWSMEGNIEKKPGRNTMLVRTRRKSRREPYTGYPKMLITFRQLEQLRGSAVSTIYTSDSNASTSSNARAVPSVKTNIKQNHLKNTIDNTQSVNIHIDKRTAKTYFKQNDCSVHHFKDAMSKHSPNSEMKLSHISKGAISKVQATSGTEVPQPQDIALNTSLSSQSFQDRFLNTVRRHKMEMEDSRSNQLQTPSENEACLNVNLQTTAKNLLDGSLHSSPLSAMVSSDLYSMDSSNKIDRKILQEDDKLCQDVLNQVGKSIHPSSSDSQSFSKFHKSDKNTGSRESVQGYPDSSQMSSSCELSQERSKAIMGKNNLLHKNAKSEQANTTLEDIDGDEILGSCENTEQDQCPTTSELPKSSRNTTVISKQKPNYFGLQESYLGTKADLSLNSKTLLNANPSENSFKGSSKRVEIINISASYLANYEDEQRKEERRRRELESTSSAMEGSRCGSASNRSGSRLKQLQKLAEIISTQRKDSQSNDELDSSNVNLNISRVRNDSEIDNVSKEPINVRGNRMEKSLKVSKSMERLQPDNLKRSDLGMGLNDSAASTRVQYTLCAEQLRNVDSPDRFLQAQRTLDSKFRDSFKQVLTDVVQPQTPLDLDESASSVIVESEVSIEFPEGNSTVSPEPTQENLLLAAETKPLETIVENKFFNSKVISKATDLEERTTSKVVKSVKNNPVSSQAYVKTMKPSAFINSQVQNRPTSDSELDSDDLTYSSVDNSDHEESSVIIPKADPQIIGVASRRFEEPIANTAIVELNVRKHLQTVEKLNDSMDHCLSINNHDQDPPDEIVATPEDDGQLVRYSSQEKSEGIARVFNDLDIESDSEEWDIHGELRHWFKEESDSVATDINGLENGSKSEPLRIEAVNDDFKWDDESDTKSKHSDGQEDEGNPEGTHIERSEKKPDNDIDVSTEESRKTECHPDRFEDTSSLSEPLGRANDNVRTDCTTDLNNSGIMENCDNVSNSSILDRSNSNDETNQIVEASNIEPDMDTDLMEFVKDLCTQKKLAQGDTMGKNNPTVSDLHSQQSLSDDDETSSDNADKKCIIPRKDDKEVSSRSHEQMVDMRDNEVEPICTQFGMGSTSTPQKWTPKGKTKSMFNMLNTFRKKDNSEQKSSKNSSSTFKSSQMSLSKSKPDVPLSQEFGGFPKATGCNVVSSAPQFDLNMLNMTVDIEKYDTDSESDEMFGNLKYSSSSSELSNGLESNYEISKNSNPASFTSSGFEVSDEHVEKWKGTSKSLEENIDLANKESAVRVGETKTICIENDNSKPLQIEDKGLTIRTKRSDQNLSILAEVKKRRLSGRFSLESDGPSTNVKKVLGRVSNKENDSSASNTSYTSSLIGALRSIYGGRIK